MSFIPGLKNRGFLARHCKQRSVLACFFLALWIMGMKISLCQLFYPFVGKNASVFCIRKWVIETIVFFVRLGIVERECKLMTNQGA
jgi:hypothetical protein